MNDPLAHLYADVLEDEVDLPTRTVTLDDLVNAHADGAEFVSDHDVDELVLLVESKVGAGTFSDAESVELGLGQWADVDGEPLLVLNELGRRVGRRMAERAGLAPPR